MLAHYFSAICIVLAIPGRHNLNHDIRPSTGPYSDILAAPSIPAKTTRAGCRITYKGFIDWMNVQQNPFYRYGVGPKRFIQSESPRIVPEGSMNIIYNCADIIPTDRLPLIGLRILGTWKITCDPTTEMPFIDEWTRPPGSVTRYMNEDVPRIAEHDVFTIGRCLSHEQYERRTRMRKGTKEEIDLTEEEQPVKDSDQQARTSDLDLAQPIAQSARIEGLVVAALSNSI